LYAINSATHLLLIPSVISMHSREASDSAKQGLGGGLSPRVLLIEGFLVRRSVQLLELEEMRSSPLLGRLLPWRHVARKKKTLRKKTISSSVIPYVSSSTLFNYKIV